MSKSICKVENVIPEDVKGYIDQNELLKKLLKLFPQVKSKQEFNLNVSRSDSSPFRGPPRQKGTGLMV